MTIATRGQRVGIDPPESQQTTQLAQVTQIEEDDMLNRRIRSTETVLKDITRRFADEVTLFKSQQALENSNSEVHLTDFLFKDPQGELTNKNVLIVFGSIKDTNERFDFSVEDVEKYLAEAKQILFEARSQRPRPNLDDKIITTWNGLMISGLAYVGVAIKNKQYIQYAEDNANFIERYLYDKMNILLQSCYRADGDIIMQPLTPIHGFHADYAFVVQELLDLYGANLNTH
ncbi:hypothetical protein KQX54_000856 [Cotesia glomerata]|uniref:Uncharacterized protein n=1 Tax=Cotesia glomerata TaxID=32391 RepID=A0AAV7HSU4_COTGL|nr:hypothetical protein KQX54_000856 [Cotesia glomerata]